MLAAPRDVLRAAIGRQQQRWPGDFVMGLASSRTLRELTVLQRALALPGPCIAEDGARHATDRTGRALGHASGATRETHGRRVLHTWSHALSAAALRDRLRDVEPFVRADTAARPASALRALGFATYGSVRRALQLRTHSVLLDPQMWSEDELMHVRDITAARRLQLRRGGRWFTVTTAGGKGPALRALRHQFTMNGVPPIVAAIGNEENDESLLAEADCRFVIRNPHRGPHPVLSQLPGAIVLDTEGAGGWMEMLERLIPAARDVLAQRAHGVTS